MLDFLNLTNLYGMCLQFAFPSTSVMILNLLLGADKLFLYNLSIIFELVISEAKFHIAIHSVYVF